MQKAVRPAQEWDMLGEIPFENVLCGDIIPWWRLAEVVDMGNMRIKFTLCTQNIIVTMTPTFPYTRKEG